MKLLEAKTNKKVKNDKTPNCKVILIYKLFQMWLKEHVRVRVSLLQIKIKMINLKIIFRDFELVCYKKKLLFFF